MKLSIIVVNLNTKDLTEDCIKSISKGGLKESDYEIFVTDNGSDDGSVEMLQKYEKKLKNFKAFYNDSNTGYAKANNQGLRASKGKYKLLLNNDTLVHKDSLKRLVEFAEKTKDVGVVGSKLLNTDGTLQASCFNFPTISRAIREYWLGKKGLFAKFAPKSKNPVEVDSVVGAVFLITPKAFKKVGLLDERYFAYFEDIDYCRQVWKNGMKVYYLPKSVITHHHGATFKKLSVQKDRWKKLIPSSKVYHGFFKHYIINGILWTGQKWQKLLKKAK